MKKTIFPATLLCDFYKVSHREQYPSGTEKVFSTWIPRSNKYFPKADKVVAFGFQGFIKKYMIEYFDNHFFSRDKEEVVSEYVRYIKFTLGVENPDSSHIEELHDLGYLPIRIRAVKEGTEVPIRVPMLVMENTHPNFFWLTNYLETIISSEIWLPSTTATIARAYRKLLDEYAYKTTDSNEGVIFQGHDFSMRGLSSLESASTSGAGHLLSFAGTDTIPAIAYHEHYYNANIEKELVGASIPATEHSVMTAYGKVNEFELFKHLMTNIYSNGLFSVVSDTWDFWRVIGEYLPMLKNEVMSRDGKVVIRPDSGDPVKIIVGDPYGKTELERKGLIECLWEIFGGEYTLQGYKVLDSHIGAIYGDSITIERAEQILEGLMRKGFASTNIVFGIGSFSYQYQTRDTFGYAMKATYVKVNGEERAIFKDPKTDDGTKKSLTGLVAVVNVGNNLEVEDNLSEHQYNSNFVNLDKLELVFEDGKLLREQSLEQIRDILNEGRF